MEIRVVVKDAFAASDLTWFLNAPARVVPAKDGGGVVHIQVEGNVNHVLARIRDWLRLDGVSPVVVHVGESASILSAE